MSFTLIRRHLAASAVVVLAAVGVGACGASDEEEVRRIANEFHQSMREQDGSRACALMSPRASAQATTLLATLGGGGAARSCEKLLENSDPDDQPSRADVAKATLTIRDDRALLRYRGTDHQPMGLRKIDGDWRVDNLLNPSLHEKPRRSEPQLVKGSDAEQVRATIAAVADAFAKKDLERACGLFSDGAEAQILMGAAFMSLGDPKASETTTFTCEKALGVLTELAGADSLADLAPPARKLGSAKVTIRKDRATVRMRGEDAAAMIRVDGRWLIDADPQSTRTTAGDLKRCWRRAGAAIATDADDLRFADGSRVNAIGIADARVSVKGRGGWRIFYTLSADGEDPGLAKVLSKPSSIGAVAYVRDAASHPDVVAKARDCD